MQNWSEFWVFKGQNVGFKLKIGQNVDFLRINVGFELKIGQNHMD